MYILPAATVALLMFATASAITPVNGNESVTESSVQEVDLRSLSAEAPKVLRTFRSSGKNGWRLDVEAPIIWADKDGESHEITQLSPQWRNWLGTIGPKMLREWSDHPAREGTSIRGTVSLRTPKRVGNLEFTPDEDEVAKPMSACVTKAAGLTANKPLGCTLPSDALTATELYLNFRLRKGPTKVASVGKKM